MANSLDRLASAISRPDRVLFLDVETTGLSRYYDELTLIGYEIDGVYDVFVQGDPPDKVLQHLANADTLVTFNGTLFDVPFVRKTFGEVSFPSSHVDLRYVARRIGLSGGQKAIEQELGIAVRENAVGVDGFSAVLLWHDYLRGNRSALRKLIAYNHADVRGMAAILDHVIENAPHADLFQTSYRFFPGYRHSTGYARRNAKLPPAERLNKRSVHFTDLLEEVTKRVIVGIDLTGSEVRPSGYCELSGKNATTSMINRDADLLEAIRKCNPILVSIDSPLSLPNGRIRVTDDDPGRDQFGIMRICERTLKKRGINVYPCLLPSMQRLTERGMRLAEELRALGIPVIESYPGAAQDIIGIPRKGAGEILLKQGLLRFGIEGPFGRTPVKHDELDAITSALVGTFFLAGKFEALSGPNEGALIIPDLLATPLPAVVGFSGPIAVGKTEAARSLEKRGYRYVRFSQIIDDVIETENLPHDRATRQEVGWRIHRERGQRWLCEKVVERVKGASHVVIDGLRFPDDHAFMFETFGANFLHVHLIANAAIRRRRSQQQGISAQGFEDAEKNNTESKISVLEKLSDIVIRNEGSCSDFLESVEVLVDNKFNSPKALAQRKQKEPI